MMGHENNRTVPILFHDDSENSKNAVKLVREVEPDAIVVSTEQEHSDFTLPVLITREGIALQGIWGIRPFLTRR